MSSSQSEERTMVFTREKSDTSNKNRERCFSRVRKMIRPIRSHRGVWVPRQNSRFWEALAACGVALQTFNVKSFSRRVFLVKLEKWKTSRKLKGNSFVCFTVDEEDCREPAKQQRTGKNRTRRKLKFCFLSELLYPLFKPIFKAAILLKLQFIHLIFNCAFRSNS